MDGRGRGYRQGRRLLAIRSKVSRSRWGPKLEALRGTGSGYERGWDSFEGLSLGSDCGGVDWAWISRRRGCGADFLGKGGSQGTVLHIRPRVSQCPAALAQAHSWSHEDPLSGKRGQGSAVSEGAARAPGERGLT